MRRLMWSAVIGAALVASCVGDERADEAWTAQAVLTSCDPRLGTLAMNADKELIVRDLSVVEDPCRTGWTATGCTAATLGAWTFGRLMAGASGATDVDSPVARAFVASWLARWLAPQQVTGDPTPVAPRPAIASVMLQRWLTDSGCPGVTDPTACATLDLKAAPFRLLAVVNRVDLENRTASGAGAPGEIRFVFGAFSRASASLPPVNMTAILEYKYGPRNGAQGFATSFHQLGSVAFGPDFARQLQAITDLVTLPQPQGANHGTLLSKIRTSENAFDPRPPAQKQWELRQFQLPCTSGTCLLAQVGVSQTPPTTANASQALTDYLVAHQTEISTSRHALPLTMLGGSSLSPAGASAVVWNTIPDATGVATLVKPSDPAFSYTVRHNFAFSTCNGCHLNETGNQNRQFHIAPRAQGAVASLSGFLTRNLASGNLILPDDYLAVTDPDPDSYDALTGEPTTFVYNELWRRSCEVRRVLAGLRAPVTTPTGHDIPAPPGSLPDPQF